MSEAKMSHKVGQFYQYSGAVHIHTTESDGTKTLQEVAALGREVGLDFMMFADHMGLTNREARLEGFYGDTLVVIGYEHNDVDDNNHYIVFDSPRVYPAEMTAKEYVAAAADDGALGIIAHPIEHRPREGKYPPYPWTEWSTDRFDGIELWNQMSEWMEKLGRFNKLQMVMSPRKSMVGPTEELLRIWDEFSKKRRCVGIAGVDAHAFPVRIGPWTLEIFPYKVHFKCLRTNIILDEPLSKDVDTARGQLYQALRRCRVFGSNVRWGNTRGFEFLARTGQSIYTCGDSLPLTEEVSLQVNLPGRALVRLVHDGRSLIEAHTNRLEYTVARPGLYRVEAWKGKRGWIFSNHIRIEG